MKSDSHLDPVQQALQTITLNLLSCPSELQELKEKLELADKHHKIEDLARGIKENRIVLPTFQLLDRNGLCDNLQKRLQAEAEEVRRMNGHRDRLIEKLCPFLDDRKIDYVLFKTMNKSGAIGVDIDVMIDYENFDRCVSYLEAQGFRPIDDLSKKYATGFVYEDNPIIIDLHTELTVLGIRYISAKSLLSSKMRIDFQSDSLSGSVRLNVLDDVMETVVRMAHCIIKEGTITVADMMESIRVIENCSVATLEHAEREGLQVAVSAFLQVLTSVSNCQNPITDSKTFDEGITNRITRVMVEQSTNSKRLPVKLPAMLSFAALLSRLKRNDEMTDYLLLSLYSLRYRRNIEQIGRKIVSYIG